MKKYLLFIISIFAMPVMAQSPIPAYYGGYPDNSDPWGDGIWSRNYMNLTSDSPIEEPAGENVIWDFQQLTQTGLAFYINSIPTPEEISEYPGTTLKLNETSTVGTTTSNAVVYVSESAGSTSITGAITESRMLNYSTDNGFIGEFPLTYGYSNTDATAGNYVFGTYSGSFAGTISTSVDAYGLISTNLESGQMPVTRLKTEQSSVMTYLGVPNAGTIEQTVYYYYADMSSLLFPVFKSMYTTISIPALGIVETYTDYQYSGFGMLNVPGSSLTSKIEIAPNPASDIVYITANQLIESVDIVDINGRIIERQTGNTIKTSNLVSGTYFLKIATSEGSTLKKLIKI